MRRDAVSENHLGPLRHGAFDVLILPDEIYLIHDDVVDLIVKQVVEVIARQREFIVEEALLDPSFKRAATLGQQICIRDRIWRAALCFFESRFFDSLRKRETQPGSGENIAAL